MNNVAALCLQRFRLHEYFERGLSAETRHAPGEAEVTCLIHDTEIGTIAQWGNLSFCEVCFGEGAIANTRGPRAPRNLRLTQPPLQFGAVKRWLPFIIFLFVVFVAALAVH